MKRTLSLILCIVMLVCALPFSASAASVVSISAPADLLLITTAADTVYELKNDITLTPDMFLSGGLFEGGFVPVGNGNNPFKGTLDGKGYTLSGLTVTTNGQYGALIGYNGGTVKNLHLKDVSVTLTAATATPSLYNVYAAGLVARNGSIGLVMQCSVSGAVSATVTGNSNETNTPVHAGGVVGCNHGSMVNCFSDAVVSGSNNNAAYVAVGGLVGKDDAGSIVTSFSRATVSATSTAAEHTALWAGVAVGYAYDDTLSAVYSDAAKGDAIGQVQTDATVSALGSGLLNKTASFTGFNFSSVWEMGSAYPTLRTHEHKWDGGKVTKAPTAKKEGVRTYTCTLCRKTKTAKIAKLTDTLTVFKDIKKGDWFVKNGAIDFVYNRGLFNGTSATTFGANENMTRAMFVTVLGRLDGVKVSDKASTPFTDVKKGQYYTGYVKWANDNGIVNGTSDTAFSPEANINREQICAIMVRYCDYAKIKLQNKNKAISFKDAAQISGYAKKAIAACQRGGVVNGEKKSDGYYFRPQGFATRAEVATIMMNFTNNYMK